jgi:hypothetical protein
MYSDYRTLFKIECSSPSTGLTDSTRFSCGSLPFQTQVRKSIQDPQMFDVNEPAECRHDYAEEKPSCSYRCEMPSPQQPQQSPQTQPIPMQMVKEGFQLPTSSALLMATPIPKTSNTSNTSKTSMPKDSDKLLPVLDPVFNLREICKQSILLEDHLSQPEKRCTDCCVKHFLTIEALAEEAVTLDKQKEHQKLEHLPAKIRELQKLWFQDPTSNAHTVSQKLREIRKVYQIDCFDIIFRDGGCESCTDGVCKIKR